MHALRLTNISPFSFTVGPTFGPPCRECFLNKLHLDDENQSQEVACSNPNPWQQANSPAMSPSLQEHQAAEADLAVPCPEAMVWNSGAYSWVLTVGTYPI